MFFACLYDKRSFGQIIETMKQLLLLASIVLLNAIGVAQNVPLDKQPPSWTKKMKKEIPMYTMPEFDLQKLQKEDAKNDLDKSIPWRFGYKHDVDHNLNNSGAWSTLPNGDRVWRIMYHSPGAHTLNFMFFDFEMPKGGKVYVYNHNKTDILRPFTSDNNNPERILGTWLVKGDKAIIEYVEPAAVAGQGRLEISEVVHGYRTAETYKQQKALNSSGDCNVDVNCNIGTGDSMKEDVKKSVAMLVTGGSGFCSGALVNNTSNDGTPYFLTANHCVGTGTVTGWAFRFNWRSDASVADCATTAPSVDNSYNETVSGAILRARRTESDFALIEITDTGFFAASPDVVWAGWDRSDVAPAYTVGIHHPAGDIQKVCRDDNQPTAIDNGQEFWQITAAGSGWELGVTEGGSSGSPLFDPNGRIIGQLWRGAAACSGTNDNDLQDDYGRFGISWDTGTTADARLRDWLDPTNTGDTTVDQYPPLAVYDYDAKVTVNNTTTSHCDGAADLDIVIRNDGTTTLTSATINYNIDGGTNQTINWTGSLLQGESEVAGTGSYTGLAAGAHTFSASVSNPNGTTDQNTFNDNSANNFDVPTSFDTITIELELTTDDYAAETGWELRDAAGTVIQSVAAGNYTNNNTTTTETINIPANGCYTFALTDDYGDGICCTYGNGSYTLRDGSGNTIASGATFGSEDATLFRAFSTLSISDEELNATTIFPNPSTGIYTIRTVQSGLNYEVFNVLGQSVLRGTFNDTENTINLQNQTTGMYLLKVYDGNAVLNVKLIKK